MYIYISISSYYLHSISISADKALQRNICPYIYVLQDIHQASKAMEWMEQI